MLESTSTHEVGEGEQERERRGKEQDVEAR
jgi:hypothetical protein